MILAVKDSQFASAAMDVQTARIALVRQTYFAEAAVYASHPY